MKFWTEERIEQLRTLSKTHSSGKVAVELGCSRCAVSGAAARNGISFGSVEGKIRFDCVGKDYIKKEPKPTKPPKATKKVVFKPKSVIIPDEPKPEPVVIQSNPKTIWELGDFDCHWPIGDPLSDEFRYCGAPKSGKNYCAGHTKLGTRQ